MKDYLNRKEYPNGDITVKLVKMGSDIDDTRNYRVRGIIKTENNKNIFIEILQGKRFSQKDTGLSSEEYLKKYPNEEYIWIHGCFRVDIPEDYSKNYTAEFSKYDYYAFYEYEHSKENIIKVLQNFNKDIKGVELVEYDYIDEYCNQNGFYTLYDDRLEHSLVPNKILDINNRKIVFDMEYTCTNFDRTITYSENMRKSYEFDLDNLNKIFGLEKMKLLLSDYEKKLEKFRSCFKNEKTELEEIEK